MHSGPGPDCVRCSHVLPVQANRTKTKTVQANPSSSSLATVQAVCSAPSPTCLFWATISLVVHIVFFPDIWVKGLTPLIFHTSFLSFQYGWWKNLSLLQESGHLYHKRQNSFRHITSMAWDNYITREVETSDGDFSMNTSQTVDWVYRKTACWVHVFFFFHHHHNKLLSPCAHHFDLTVKICIGSQLWRGSSYVYYVHFHGPGQLGWA